MQLFSLGKYIVKILVLLVVGALLFWFFYPDDTAPEEKPIPDILLKN